MMHLTHGSTSHFHHFKIINSLCYSLLLAHPFLLQQPRERTAFFRLIHARDSSHCYCWSNTLNLLFSGLHHFHRGMNRVSQQSSTVACPGREEGNTASHPTLTSSRVQLHVHSGGISLPHKHLIYTSIQRRSVIDPVDYSLTFSQYDFLLLTGLYRWGHHSNCRGCLKPAYVSVTNITPEKACWVCWFPSSSQGPVALNSTADSEPTGIATMWITFG